MIKRTLYFGNPAYLSLGNAQMVVRYPEIEKQDLLSADFKKTTGASIPVEDIGIVVLDNQQLTITQGLLGALMDNNVAVINCDKTHHPSGLLMPLSGNTIQNERFRAQLDASEPLKKQLWGQTITQKIRNQCAVLQCRGIDHSYLVPLYKNVRSGDTDNSEATAAAYYWGRLFEGIEHFKRERDGNAPNSYLNYGYALLRATMARSIVGAGLLPTLGIHHQNRYNAYCLADDLMEPYRPFVDRVVCELIDTHGLKDDMPKELKAILLKIPAMDVVLDGEKSPLMVAMQRTAVSLVKCFEGEQKKLLYPEMI